MTSAPPGERLQQLWADFCDELKAAGPVLGRPSTPDDALTLAEGVRHLSRLTRIGLEANVETMGPDFPALLRLVDETKKFGCDNPNTVYQSSPVDGNRSYRVSGTRGTVDYLSFTTQRLDGTTLDGTTYVQTGFLDSSELVTGPDGRFEITLSSRDSDTPESGGNWLAMQPDTARLSVRQTFLDRSEEEPADLRIERVDSTGTPPPLTIEQIEQQLTAAAGFVRYCASTFTDWTESYRAHPNELPPADQAKCLAAGGDPNIYFYRSYWQLDEGSALVVHLPRVPECDTWNLQVDNYWQESMDYRYFRSWINKHTAMLDPDGSMTAVIAHDDPAQPNWLQTAGHRLGHFAMRYVRAEEHVDPVTRLCKLEDVAGVVDELRRAA